MNTLREIEAHVGGLHPLSLRAVGERVAILSGEQRTSVRAMAAALEHLPALTLDVEAVGDTSGVVPFLPAFRVLPSKSVIVSTTFTLLFPDGASVPGVEPNDVRDYVGYLRLAALNDPGAYVVHVRRTGISSTGVTVLEKHLGVVAKAKPGPPPPITPPTITPPTITVRSNGDGSFKVSGSGFLPPTAKVNILIGDGTFRNPLVMTATAENGTLADFPTGKICQVPGRNLFFEATDGRMDPANHKTVMSNTVELTCPL